MRTKAISARISIEEEKKRVFTVTSAMIFMLAALLVLTLFCRNASGASGWKFTPEPQGSTEPAVSHTGKAEKDIPPAPGELEPESRESLEKKLPPVLGKYKNRTDYSDPVVAAAVKQFVTTFNCSTVEVGGRTYPCNMRGADLRGLTFMVPEKKTDPLDMPRWKTKEEVAIGDKIAWINSCSIDNSSGSVRKGYIGHLSHGFMPQADLTGADFSDAKMCNIDIRGAKLRDVSFVGAHLFYVDFRDSDLTGADFTNAVLGLYVSVDKKGLKYSTIGPHVTGTLGHQFDGAILTGVKFRGTEFHGPVDFTGARLNYADFTGAKFCRGIENTSVSSADFSGAILPDGTVCQPNSIGKCRTKEGTDKFREYSEKARQEEAKKLREQQKEIDKEFRKMKEMSRTQKKKK